MLSAEVQKMYLEILPVSRDCNYQADLYFPPAKPALEKLVVMTKPIQVRFQGTVKGLRIK